MTFWGRGSQCISFASLCGVRVPSQNEPKKNEHFMWFRNSHGLKSSDIFSVCFSIRPLSSSHLIITHTIVVCECITIVKSVLHPFEFLFYDQTYFISNWLFTSNTSCFVVGVFNRHRVILLPRKREKKTRAREIYNLKTKNIYIEININKIQ